MALPALGTQGGVKMMAPLPSRTITLELPGDVYEQVRRHAEKARRPLEAALVDVIRAGVQQPEGMPGGVTDGLDQLRALDTPTLTELAQTRRSEEESAEIEALNLQQQRDGLGAEERRRRDTLLRRYERSLLIRAEAAALLQERGVDLAPLLHAPR